VGGSDRPAERQPPKRHSDWGIVIIQVSSEIANFADVRSEPSAEEYVLLPVVEERSRPDSGRNPEAYGVECPRGLKTAMGG
jgi:hypothetical protein